MSGTPSFVAGVAGTVTAIALVLLLGACSRPAPPAAPAAPPPAGEAAIRVRAEAVVAGAVRPSGQVTGVVSPFRMATIAAEVAGRVVARSVEPGDAVAAGAPLVTLDADRARTTLAEAEAQLAARRVDLAEGSARLRRALELREQAFVSADSLDQLRFAEQRAAAMLAAAGSAVAHARRALADTAVRAPFAGTAEVVHVDTGDYVSPGAPIATVADFSRARVRAGVTAAEAAVLAAGGLASLAFEALGGGRVDGRIHSIARVADPGSGTYAVEVWVDGEVAAGLREGMVASVELPLPQSTPQALVPRAAVFRSSGAMHVWVVEGHGDGARVRLQPVEVGRSDPERVEIVHGLAVGERVVVDGLFALSNGARVSEQVAAAPAPAG